MKMKGIKKFCVVLNIKQTIQSHTVINSRNIVNKPVNTVPLVRWSKNTFLKTPVFLKYLRRVVRPQKETRLVILGMSFFGPSILFLESDSTAKNEDHLGQITSQESHGKHKNYGVLDKIVYVVRESTCIIMRCVQLCMTFIPIFTLYPITYLGYYPQELWWKLLLKGIECSGPIFIKFGQWVSTRRDLFPEICCNQFSRLQRRSRPHSLHYTKQQLAKAFGKNWRKIFVKFDNNSEPIGSGCVAQVYKVWVSEDHIKNKDILDEIVGEIEDNEDDRMGLIDDGLEVIGFQKWVRSASVDLADEQKAIDEFKRDRKKKRDMLQKSEEKSLETFSSLSVEEVTTGLADEIISQNEFSSQDSEKSKDDSMSLDEENVEHALVEQWYMSPESLEKSLPFNNEDDSQDMEGLVPLALKVLHPGVYRIFKRDMSILRGFASFITFVYPPLKWLNLERCLDEFFNVMSAQIDLRREADNLDKFIDFFSSVDTVRFPRPVRPFVTRRILAETFEEGEPMVNFIVEEKSGSLKKNLARIGVDTLLKMIFTDNFIHCDLHPGNLLIQNETAADPESDMDEHDGNASRFMMVDVGGDTFVMNVVEDPKPLRICILDCGIVATLKEKDLNNFRAVFQKVVLGQGESVADLFLKNSEHRCKDPESFRTAMNNLVQNARSNALSLEQVDVGILLQQVLRLLLQHRVRLESAFSAVVLAVFVLEGLGRSLDPEMDILERARPLLVP